ncbi:MAG TPA: glycerate kinase [Mycobacteriales bacterium]|nr:glycerate kinase [Mycobacteriales bacterium]
MRVVIAPDSFGEALTAAQAAAAIARGWLEAAPDDEVELVPLSDGGPGFAAAVATASPDSHWLGPGLVQIGATAYVESAVGCGRDRIRAVGAAVGTGSTYDVGAMVRVTATAPGVETVVVGLGGSVTNDGGAGAWAALGAAPADGLGAGGLGLAGLDRLTMPPPLGVRLVAAADVDNPLLGPHGASHSYGPQKGAGAATVAALEAAMTHWADLVEAATGLAGLRDEPGAGAAGGLGFGLLALGAQRVPGVDLVADALGLADRIAAADLVITGEGRYDATSLRGKAVAGVAQRALVAAVPCIVLAGDATVGRRQAAAHGVDAIHTVAELFGSVEAGIAAGEPGLHRLARETARQRRHV